jgi:hypothetical protein
MAESLPPAGWYPDPSGSSGQQYWDGSKWARPPVKKAPQKWPWIALSVVVLIIILAQLGKSGSDNSSTSSSSASSASAATTSAPAAAPTTTTPQGPQPPAGVKNLTFDVQPGPDGDIVTARYKISENLTAGLTKDGARIDTVSILKYAQAAYPNLAEVDVDASADMVDTYGNTKYEQVATLIYTRATLDKINWENFDFKNVWNVPIALPVYIHPAFLY